MKQKIVNGRWAIITTNAVADWDGGTGDYSVRRGWEFERFESFRRELRYGDIFMEVGAEHGWMSAIIGREFVGAENMILIEPSPEFWINIRKTWEYNGLNLPLGCFHGFAGAETTGDAEEGWPAAAIVGANEIDAMAYRSIGAEGVLSIRIDDYVTQTGHVPRAINIDVEGAEGLVIQGAEKTLKKHKPLVWVSVHPDLMERDYDTSKDRFLIQMAALGYTGEHLGTDHEEHWLFKP